MRELVVAQVWTGDRREDPALLDADGGDRRYGEPPFVRVGHPTKHPVDQEITIGRSPSCSVVVADSWVSEIAVRMVPTPQGWIASLVNRHGTEHRRWGQQAQSLRGTAPPSGARTPVTVALHGDQHAFMFPCGEDNERTVCVTVETRMVEQSDLDDADSHGTSTTTPRKIGRLRDMGAQRIDRMRQMYWQFLVWPPRLRPQGCAPNSFKVQIGKDHVKVLRHLEGLGYALPERPTEIQAVLPEQLVDIGLFTFDDHALWRDMNGHVQPYLTDDEKYRRGRSLESGADGPGVDGSGVDEPGADGPGADELEE